VLAEWTIRSSHPQQASAEAAAAAGSNKQQRAATGRATCGPCQAITFCVQSAQGIANGNAQAVLYIEKFLKHELAHLRATLSFPFWFYHTHMTSITNSSINCNRASLVRLHNDGFEPIAECWTVHPLSECAMMDWSRLLNAGPCIRAVLTCMTCTVFAMSWMAGIHYLRLDHPLVRFWSSAALRGQGGVPANCPLALLLGRLLLQL